MKAAWRCSTHLVVEQRVGREEVYRFQHALIREVPYEALIRRRKARLHERVGLALEAVSAGSLEEHLEELAHHFAPAHSGTAGEKGVDYCLRAGEKARSLYANEAAIQHLTAALGLLEGLPEDEPHLRKRGEVVDNLQQAYVVCRAFERAQDVLQGYLAMALRASYPRGVVAAHCEMAWALRWSHEAAGIDGSESSRRLREEHLEESVQVADQHGLADWRARARVELADLLSYHGHRSDLPRAEAVLRGMLEAPEGLRKEDFQAAYGRLLQICALQGQWNEAAADHRAGPAARRYLPPPARANGRPLCRAVRHGWRPLADLWSGDPARQGPAAGGGVGRIGRRSPLRLCAGAGTGPGVAAFLSPPV
jgi:hypothetical protein